MNDDEKLDSRAVIAEGFDEEGRDANGNYVDDQPWSDEEEAKYQARLPEIRRRNAERRRARDERFASRFPEQCISFRIRRLSRLVARVHERSFAASKKERREKLELRSTQVAVLAAIARKRYSDIVSAARDLGLHRTTLSRSLSRLAKRGLVKLVVGRDHRSRAPRITAPGYEMLLEGIDRLLLGYVSTMLDFRIERLREFAGEVRQLMFRMHETLRIPRPRLPTREWPPA